MQKKIIYIVSDVRSGSTLLENILAKSPSVISVGELHHLDSHLNKGIRGKSWGWNCSCGSGFDTCEFWVDITERLKAKGITKINKTSIVSSLNSFSTKCEWDDTKDNAGVLNLLQNIYDTIFENKNDVDVIVDSSKNPIQGLAIYKNSTYDVKIVYIKRDIRAVVLSKLKWLKKNHNISASIYKILLRSKLFNWKCLNCLKAVNEIDKITISYEQLSNNPQETVDRITAKFGLSPIIVPEFMYLDNDHTVGGSPNRFEKRKIEYDGSWEAQAVKMPIFNFFGKLIDKIK